MSQTSLISPIFCGHCFTQKIIPKVIKFIVKINLYTVVDELIYFLLAHNFRYIVKY